MNKELLKKLGINENLGLRDLVDALEARQADYLFRAQGTQDDKLRNEYTEIYEQIEQEIAAVKKGIRDAESALIFDEGNEEAPAVNAPKEDTIAARVDAIKQREAQSAKEKRSAAAAQSASSSPQGSPAAPAARSAPQTYPAAAPPPTGTISGDPLRNGLIALKNQDYDTAFRLFTGLANQDPPVVKAQHALSFMYHDGLGCAKDWNGFDFWSKQAAKNGSIEAAAYRGMTLIKEGGNYPGNLTGSKAEKQEIARYNEAFDLLERAAEKDDIKAMEFYVKTVEIRYRTSANPHEDVLRSCIKSRHVNKAVEYCGRIAEMTFDAYEKKQWQDRMEALKHGRPYKPKDGGGISYSRPRRKMGCLGKVIIFFVVAVIVSSVISAIASLESSLDNYELSGGGESSSTEPAAPPLGSQRIELHDFPEPNIIDMQAVTISASYGYELDSESWDGAFAYRAGNGRPDAYADYQLDGLFETLSFRAVPLLGQEAFFKSTVVRASVIDLETDEILYSVEISADSAVTEANVNVADRNSIRISVRLVSGGNGFVNLGYTLIKDAYLDPAPQDGENN